MWRERATLVVIGVFATAAVYEVAVALQWVAPGHRPGEDPPGSAVVLIAVLAAFAATVVLGFVRVPSRFVALVPLAAAAWMTAHYYVFDPYYFPGHTRYSQARAVSPAWLYLVDLGCLFAAVVAVRLRRIGAGLAPVAVFFCFVTVLAQGVGH